MSHELRTPLNSLLILSKLLADNPDAEPHRQAGRVRARRSTPAGADLLTLISDILDLSKVEAGKMEINPGAVDVGDDAREYVERAFGPVAEQKGLELERRRRRRRAADDRHRRAAPAAGAAQPALQRVQVHRDGQRRAGARADRGARPTTARRTRSRSPSRDTGIGIAAGQAAADLRGLPAGRRHDEPALRRHRPRAVDQPRDRARCSAARSACASRRGRGRDVHAAAAATSTPPPIAPSRADAPRRRAGARAARARRRREPATSRRARADDRAQVADGDRVALDRRRRRRPRHARARRRPREHGFRGVVAPRGHDRRWRSRTSTGPTSSCSAVPVAASAGVARPAQAPPAHAPRAGATSSPRPRAPRPCSRAGAAGFLARPAYAEDARRHVRARRRVPRRPRVRQLLVVDDDEAERRSIAELVGAGDDVEVDGGRLQRGGARGARRDAASTASCSTSSCRR